MDSEKGEDMIILYFQGRQIKCNKTLLVSSSGYFKAMFSGNFIESLQNSIEIELPGFSLDVVLDIIEFIHGSDKQFLNDESCLSILSCASVLQIPKLQRLCEKFLIEHMGSENCLKIYETAYKLCMVSLCEASITFAVWSFVDVVKSKQFPSLLLETVWNFLSKAELNLGRHGERAVLNAIILWIQHNEDKYKGCVLPLLLCLDFTQLNPDDINDVFTLSSSNEVAKKVMNAVISFNTNNDLNSALKTAEKEGDDGKKEWQKWAKKVIEKRSNFRRVPCGIPCFVSSKLITDQPSTCPIVYSLDSSERSINHLVTLSKIDETANNCTGYRVCAAGPFIFITGGQFVIGSSCWNNDVWAYSTINEQWYSFPSLPTPRRNHSVCILNSVLYLMGGFGKYRISLNSVDALQLSHDVALGITNYGTWSKLPEMPFHGSGTACAFKNRVLIFANSEIHSFHPDRNAWLTLPFEEKDCVQKYYSCAVAYGDFVFLLGMRCKRVYRINPDGKRVVEYFGSFCNVTFNVCLMGSCLVSFALVKTSKGSSELVVESLCLEGEEQILGTSANESKELGSVELGKQGEVVLRKEVSWNSEALDSHGISHGCFPLLKLGKEAVFCSDSFAAITRDLGWKKG